MSEQPEAPLVKKFIPISGRELKQIIQPVDDVYKNYSRCKYDLSLLNRKYVNCLRALKTSEKEIGSLKNNFTEHYIARREYDVVMNERNEVQRTLVASKDEHKAFINEAHIRYQKVCKSLSDLQSKHDLLNTKCEELQRQVDIAKSSNVASLKKENKRLSVEIKQLRGDYNRVCQKNEQLQVTVSDYNDVRYKHDNLLKEVSSLRTTVQELQHKKNMEEKYTMLKTLFNELTARYDSLKSDCVGVTKQRDHLRSQLDLRQSEDNKKTDLLVSQFLNQYVENCSNSFMGMMKMLKLSSNGEMWRQEDLGYKSGFAQTDINYDGASAQFKNLFSSKMSNILNGESNFLNRDKQVMHKHKIKELISHSQILEQLPSEADLSIDDDQLQVIFDLQKCPPLISPITSPSPVERNEECEYDLSDDIDMTDEAINALIRKDLLLENDESNSFTEKQLDSKSNTTLPDMSSNVTSSVQCNSISAIINECKYETNEPSINMDWNQIENTSNCNSDSNSLQNLKDADNINSNGLPILKDADSNQVLHKKGLKNNSCTEEGTVNTLSIIEDDNDSQKMVSEDSTLLAELQSQHSMLTVNENCTGKSATLESIDTETNTKNKVANLLTDAVQNCTINSVVEHSQRQSNSETMSDDKGVENPEIWSIPKTVKETKDVHKLMDVSLPHAFKSVLECESTDSAFCSNSSSDDELESMHSDMVTTIQSRNQLKPSNFVNELTLGFQGNTAFVIERFKYDGHVTRGIDSTSVYNVDASELENIVAKQLSSCTLCIGNNSLKRKQTISFNNNQTLNNDEKIKRRRMSQDSNTSDVNKFSQPDDLHKNINIINVDPINKIVENEDVLDANNHSQSNKVHKNINIISIHCINKISETKNNINSASLTSSDVNDTKGTDEAPKNVNGVGIYSGNEVFDTNNDLNMASPLALNINSPNQSNEPHKSKNKIIKAPCPLSLNQNISISNKSDNIILNNNTLGVLLELNPASHMPLDVKSHSQSKATSNTLNFSSARHINMTEVRDNCSEGSYKMCAKEMTLSQGRKWIAQMIQFCENNDIVFQVAKKFLNEPPNFVAELILERVSVDIYSTPVKSSYPTEPAMTVVQKGLHNFILALENLDFKDISKLFLHKADIYLRNINSPTKMEPILRLYVTICKGKSDYWKMRMALCSAFADMDDLAIPYMFTVLQTWVDVVPRKDMPAHNHIVMKAIVQIVLLKSVKTPGYNLCNLRSLLFNYYGFSDGEDCKETFKNLIKCYIDEQNECARVLAMALTKYISINLIKEEIEFLQSVISDTSTVDRICSVITLVIHFTKHLLKQLDVESRKNNLTWLKQFGEPSYPYAVREHTNCMLEWFLKYDSVPCNMLEKV